MSEWSILRRTLSLLLLLAAPAVAHAGDAEKGKILYSSRCAFCHGASGKGDGVAAAALKPPATNFTSAEFWKSATPQTLKAAIENGTPGTAMVAFKASLNAEQVDDLLAYLQTFKAPQ